MSRFNLSGLSNEVLIASLRARVKSENEITAEVVARIAEVDARRLFLDEAYSSMFVYCT